MGGPFAAAACLAAGTLIGLGARDRCRERLRALEQWIDALETIRLLLTEERLPLGALMQSAADALAPGGGTADGCLRAIARLLDEKPSLSLEAAWREARPPAREGAAGRAALDTLFTLLGGGPMERRVQATEQALRKLRRAEGSAREQADRAGRLYARLGLLGGLTVGIALW